MILGFAHLAINTAHLDEAEATWHAHHYTCFETHRHVDNHPGKRAFSHRYQAQHDLKLLKSEDPDNTQHIPLELTDHGPTQGKNQQLIWAEHSIIIRVPQPPALAQCLEAGLGFTSVAADTLERKSPLSGWSCRLRLEAENTEPVCIDAAGATGLAFYCHRIAEDAERVLALGATDFTGIFDLTLGKRTLSLAMMRLPGGPLLELIQPRNSFNQGTSHHDTQNR